MLLSMDISLSPSSNMIIVVSTPTRPRNLLCGFGQNNLITGLPRRVGRFDIGGVDIACAATLKKGRLSVDVQTLERIINGKDGYLQDY